MSASVQWSRPERRGTASAADDGACHDLPSVAEIDALQRTAFQLPGWPETPHPDGALRWVAANHRYNSLLWEEEDQARRNDVADSEIAKNKRAIDRYNQLRNDAIESLDECILEAMQEVPVCDDAWVNSETPPISSPTMFAPVSVCAASGTISVHAFVPTSIATMRERGAFLSVTK